MADESGAAEPRGGKVINLFSGQPVSEEEDIIAANLARDRAETLEQLDLIRAAVESGEAVGIAAVIGIWDPESRSINGFRHHFDPAVQDRPMPFLAGVAQLQHQIHQILDELMEG